MILMHNKIGDHTTALKYLVGNKKMGKIKLLQRMEVVIFLELFL